MRWLREAAATIDRTVLGAFPAFYTHLSTLISPFIAHKATNAPRNCYYTSYGPSLDLELPQDPVNVTRMWYNRAADRSPATGRIQHHLAVLERPNVVRRLFYYTKALNSGMPIVNARDSDKDG